MAPAITATTPLVDVKRATARTVRSLHRKYSSGRSKPRTTEQMLALLQDAAGVALAAASQRRQHRRRNLSSRTGDLQTAIARIDEVMVGIKQERGRAARSEAYQRRWGSELDRVSAPLQYERRQLKKMLGEYS